MKKVRNQNQGWEAVYKSNDLEIEHMKKLAGPGNSVYGSKGRHLE